MVTWLRSLFGRKKEPGAGSVPAQQPASLPGRAEAIRRGEDGAEPLARSAGPIHVTDANFAEVVLEAKLPALVDVWAEWCGPCRMIAPIVEDLAATYEGRAIVAKLDADENPVAASQMQISGIPTLLLIKEGREVDRVLGYTPRHILQEKLEAILD